MDSNHKPYSYLASFGRMDSILAASDVSYEETDSLPDRDKLTYSNGFYAYCSALFVDIRGSSELPNKYKRPTLAKVYRAFISEAVAVANSASSCREVNIVGDCVWAVYNTKLQTDIDEVFSLAATLNSMNRTLQYKLAKQGLPTFKVGIGMSYGRALMIKAGYNGSGLNDVVYMGDVVNAAAKLASKGNLTWNDRPLMVSDVFQSNLNTHNQGLTERNWSRGCYHSNAVNSAMEDWFLANCP